MDSDNLQSALPHYKRVYKFLKTGITEGTFPEGSLLPSENQLCRQFSVTRPTIRQALNNLVNEKYIVKHKGKGSVVKRSEKGIGIMSITGTTSALGKSNLKTRILVKPHIGNWPENFMFPLSEWEINAGCICMERLRLVNDLPVFYDHNYLPARILQHFSARNMENRSLFEVLRKNYDIEIKGGEQRLRAIPATEKISDALNVSPGHPVLHLQRKLLTNRGDVFIYSSLFCNTSDYALFGNF